MTPQMAMKNILEGAHSLTQALVEDLDDKDIMVRPVPTANHIAWQLGHLVSSEVFMVSVVPGAKMPALPAGFNEKYTKDTAKSDDPAHFLTKAQYMELYDKVRAATLEILDRVSLEEMAKPAPESMRNYAPTIGDVLGLQGNHELMHSGQFTVVRRKLGKPVVF